MVGINRALRFARTAVFVTASLSAVAVVVFGGLNVTAAIDYNYPLLIMPVVTGVLTLVTLPAMLVLSRVRKDFFSSMIIFEIGWTCILWIMWLAAVIAWDVEIGSIDPITTAFALLSWIILISYCSILFTLTIRQHLRGNTGIWTRDVTETDFLAVGANSNPQIVYSKITYPNQYPPAGSPIVPQQAGSDPHAGVSHQAGTGSTNQPPAQTGLDPYSQV